MVCDNTAEPDILQPIFLKMSQNYIEKILRAKVYDVAIETPLDFVPSLSERMANRVF